MNQKENRDLPIEEATPTLEVPVFNCLVHLGHLDSGEVRARVANLSGLECIAANEREVLAQIVPAFKNRILELRQAGKNVPWIENPSPLESGEVERLIPVHL